MSEQYFESFDKELLHQQALSGWDNEGGASSVDSQFEGEAIGKRVPTVSDAVEELRALHIHVIALETLVLSLLIATPEPQLKQAYKMAHLISPRQGATRSPLKTEATSYMDNLLEHVFRFRRSPLP